MQQLKDSMAQQAQTQGQTDSKPTLKLQQETPNLSDTAAPHCSSSPQAQSIGHMHPQDRHGVGPVNFKEGKRTGLISFAGEEAEEVQSGQQSHAHSILTESEIERDQPKSQAGSEVEEEEGAAAAHTAESVVESVSDFQYSMDFESSIHRSPPSGFRSPIFGESPINLLH